MAGPTRPHQGTHLQRPTLWTGRQHSPYQDHLQLHRSHKFEYYPVCAHKQLEHRLVTLLLVRSELEKVDIRVGQQEKTKILNGDEKAVYAILQELKRYY
jgi:hypothetical protein